MGGIEFAEFAWNRTSELAELPLWVIYVAWPLAGVTWIVFLGEQIRQYPYPGRQGLPNDGRSQCRRAGRAGPVRRFFVLIALRVPVAFALGLACLPILLIEPRLSPMVLFNETFKAYNSFILLAVPFFL